MQNIKSKMLRTVMDVILSITAMFSIHNPVFAADVSAQSHNASTEVQGVCKSDVLPASVAASSYTSGHTYTFPTFTFTNTNQGSAKTISGFRVRFRFYFKKADSQPTDIDMKILFRPHYYENGNTIFLPSLLDKRILSSSCQTRDGYHYYQTDWINLNSGSYSTRDYSLFYDACTEWGKTGTGAYRSATVKVEMDVD